jgi:hypothetical protein
MPVSPLSLDQGLRILLNLQLQRHTHSFLGKKQFHFYLHRFCTWKQWVVWFAYAKVRELSGQSSVTLNGFTEDSQIITL